MTIIEDRNLKRWGAQLDEDLSAARLPVLISACVLAFSAWFMFRGYSGIQRDALHYTALALSSLQPERFETEFIFQNGNAAMSVFPKLHEWCVHLLGPSLASLLIVLGSQVLWWFAICSLATAIFGRTWLMIVSVIAASLLVSYYGLWGNIRYGEPLLTPRTSSEAAALLALARWIDGKYIAVIIWIVLAALIHPIMSGPAILLLTTLHFGYRKGLVGTLIAGFLTFALAGAVGISPFTLLFEQYDPEWLAILNLSMPQVYLHNWMGLSLISLGLPVAVLCLSVMAGKSTVRTLSLAVLTVAPFLTFLGYVGGELFDNILLVVLHFWRSLWLLMVFGNLFAVYVLLCGALHRRSRTFLAFAIAGNLIEPALGQYPLFSATCALAALASECAHRYGTRAIFTVFLVISLCGVACGTLASLTWIIIHFQQLDTYGDFISILKWNVAPLFAICMTLYLLIHSRNNVVLSNALMFPVLLIAAISAYAFDKRSDWQRYVEAPVELPAEVERLVNGKQVYWEGGAEMNWIALRQSSYFSCTQAAASLIDRDAALIYAERGLALAKLNTSDFRDSPVGWCLRKNDSNAKGPEHIRQIAAACQKRPDLDTIVLRNRIGNSSALSVTITSEDARDDEYGPEDSDEKPGVFFVYDCNTFRG